MLRLVLLTVLATVAFGSIVPKIPSSRLPQLDGRIVGGDEVDIKDHPYQVSLQYFGSHFCGGTIVAQKWIVTAAHCTAAVPSGISIRAGSSNRGSGGQSITVAKVHQHPQYDPRNIDYDISVLELSQNVQWTDTTSAADLPADNAPIAEGTVVRVSGWGTTSEGGSSPSLLRGVDVNVVGLQKCRDAYGSSSITERMLCAAVSGGGKDACQGDSGGPLVAKNTLWGVVSWGYGCARPTHPGVYASVPNLRSYVRQITGL